MAYFAMTKLALRWALTKPPTSRYPFEARRIIAGSRGRLVFTKDNCVYCTVCAKKCPTGALMVNHFAARLLGAGDGFAGGIAGDFHSDFAIGNFG